MGGLKNPTPGSARSPADFAEYLALKAVRTGI
jgi:hypothetical protein